MTTTKPRSTPTKAAPATPAAPTSYILEKTTAVERYAGSCPTPKLVIKFQPHTPARVMSAEMFRAAAAIELATPGHEQWIVQAQHRGTADRVVVTIELARGTDAEIDSAVAVLQAVALQLEGAR